MSYPTTLGAGSSFAIGRLTICIQPPPFKARENWPSEWTGLNESTGFGHSDDQSSSDSKPKMRAVAGDSASEVSPTWSVGASGCEHPTLALAKSAATTNRQLPLDPENPLLSIVPRLHSPLNSEARCRQSGPKFDTPTAPPGSRTQRRRCAHNRVMMGVAEH